MLGFLAKISQTISGLGQNVIDVDHRRLANARPARSATPELTFEARDARYGAAVVAAIMAAGLDPVILPP
jgi:threonine dehydratase